MTGLLLIACAGCAEAPPERAPAYRNLARGLVPRLEPLAVGTASPGPAGVRLDEAETGIWTELRVPDEAWSPVSELPGVWQASRSTVGASTVGRGAENVRVHVRGEPMSGIPSAQAAAALRRARTGEPQSMKPGHFSLGPHVLWVSSAPDAPPPEDVRLSEHVRGARLMDGVARVSMGRYTGDGFLVPPGHRQRIRTSVPADAVLHFYTAAVPIASPSEPPPARFRVSLDGAPAYAFDHPVLASGFHRHSIPLPETEDLEIAFEVEGSAAVTGILAPRITTPRAGAERSDRPDVLVFLADTFRADNLAVYGGDPLLTPNLNRLAGECVTFLSARSTSSWTLPSHASAFTGLVPPQNGVDGPGSSLSTDAVTLAEVMRDAGYRTGAVTDGRFVSPTFGLGQGFEFFEDALEGTPEALAAVAEFLAADDGRPVFLFLQTYRAHLPYEVSEETRTRLGHVLSLEARWDDFKLPEIPRRIPEWSADYAPGADEARMFRELHDLYRGAAADVDREFAGLVSAVENGGFASDGVFVFTSDHGEAFWEHGLWEHGNGVWEEQVRIPLLVRAPGLAPGVKTENAMLSDLPRTVAALAGVPPASVWGGRDLFADGPELPRFSFECKLHPGGESMLAGYLGSKKFLLPEAEGADWDGAGAPWLFDLATDPGESRNASRESPEWGGPFLDRCAQTLRNLREPVLRSETAELTERERAALDALGYGGR